MYSRDGDNSSVWRSARRVGPSKPAPVECAAAGAGSRPSSLRLTVSGSLLPPAFTLIETLVSLAVLVIAISIVTGVFALTSKTAAQATAVADIEAALRGFFLEMEEDLKGVDPSRSVLVIYGRTQKAARNADELAAALGSSNGTPAWRVLVGDPASLPNNYDPRFVPNVTGDTMPNGSPIYSDPRADILMFFTERMLASNAPPKAQSLVGDPDAAFQYSLQLGAKVAPAQIVYGHGSFATVTPNGTGAYFWSNPQHIEVTAGNQNDDISPVAASEWMLTRRVGLPEPYPGGAVGGPGLVSPPAFTGDGSGNATSDDFTRILRGFSEDTALAGDSIVNLNNAAYNGNFDFLTYLSYFAPYDPTNSGQPTGLAERSPYDIDDVVSGPGTLGAWTLSGGRNADLVNNVLYPGGRTARHHVSTVLRDCPPELQSNRALQILPGCAWFQVEFLMPEDPRNAPDHPLSQQRNDVPRWVEVPAGQTYAFVPDSAENRTLVEQQLNADGTAVAGTRLDTFGRLIPPVAPFVAPDTPDNRRVRLWPYAIRITVRVFDQDGKLDEPLVRSMIHRFN